MEVSTVRQQLMEKRLDPFYIFTGEELEVMWIYIRKMCESTGRSLRYEECYMDILKQTETKSFLRQSCVYVVRDDLFFLKEEKAWPSLLRQDGSDTIILILSDVDKRTKFYKEFKAHIVEFHALDQRALVSQIKARVPLSEECCKRLAEVCENSLGRIFSELDKVERCSKVKGISPDQCVYRFIEEGVIYEPPRDMIFELSKQFLLRNYKASYQLLQECLEGGEAVLVILTVLYSNTRQLLQVQTCGSTTPAKIASSTGLASWQIRNALEVQGYYSASELVRILKTIQTIEFQIKAGEMEEEVAVPFLFASIFLQK